MAVSLEALAMAGADPGSPNYRLTIEEWEKKYILRPAPNLLSPKSSPSERRAKISRKNYPLRFDDGVKDGCPRRKKGRKGLMAKGFREFGVMVKRISCKIFNFFIGAIKKK